MDKSALSGKLSDLDCDIGDASTCIDTAIDLIEGSTSVREIQFKVTPLLKIIRQRLDDSDQDVADINGEIAENFEEIISRTTVTPTTSE